MATEVQTTLKIDAGQGENTLKSLREQIKQYRKELEETSITDTKFIELQKKLRETSIQVKDAMKLGTAEVEHADGSYNKLVQTMAELNKVWRATGDEAERARIGAQILDINNQLKQLDASKGNFQRNVGNYASAFDGLSTSMRDVVKEVPKLQQGLGGFVETLKDKIVVLAENIATIREEVGNVNSTMEKSVGVIGALMKSLFTWQSLLQISVAVIQILIANWDKISKLWKDKTPQEKATEAIEAMNKAIEKQKTVISQENTEALRTYIEELRNAGGDADKAREALDKYNKALRENAIAQAEANRAAANERETKLRIEKINAENRLKDLKESMQAVAGTSAVVSYLDDIKEAKKALAELTDLHEEAYNDLQKYAGETLKAEAEDLKEQSEKWIEQTERKKEAERKASEEYVEYWVKAFEETEDAMLQMLADDKAREERQAEIDKQIEDALNAEIAEFEARIKIEEDFSKWKANEDKKRKEKEIKEAEEAEARRKKLLEERVSMTADLMGNISSVFEENTIAHKSFAIAEAIINTYQAATKSLAELGWPWGQVAAASALASGFAQVKNIMAVDTSGNTNIGSYSAPAIVSAPAVVQEVPITRTTIDRDQEERLNANLSNQRVYVVYSDIEMAGKQVQVQRSESSF